MAMANQDNLNKMQLQQSYRNLWHTDFPCRVSHICLDCGFIYFLPKHFDEHVQAHGSDAMVDEDICVFFLSHLPRDQICELPFFLFMKGTEIASKFLCELKSWNPRNYVILSNIYASSGRWDEVAEVWRLMKGKQYKKAAGYSCVELSGIIHKFLVEDKSHPKSGEIYALLDEISTTMKLLGYVKALAFYYVMLDLYDWNIMFIFIYL